MYGLDLVIFGLGFLSQLVAPVPHNEDDDADEDGCKKRVIIDREGSKLNPLEPANLGCR